MDMNDVVTILSHYLGVFWVVAVIGVGHIAVRERQLLIALWSGPRTRKTAIRDLRQARPRLVRRAMYLIGGCLLVLTAWTLTISLIRDIFVGTNFSLSEPLAVPNIFTPFRDVAGSLSLLGVVGFITAGTCFTLSAGERWLATMGKLFTSLTIVGLGWLLFFAALG